MLLTTNPETSAMAVMVIEKAVSIPDKVWLLMSSEILRYPNDPGTSNIIPGTNIMDTGLFCHNENTLLINPNDKEAAKTDKCTLT